MLKLSKKLWLEAGGADKELNFVYRIGWPPRVEVTEAIASYLGKAGLIVKLVPTEVAQWKRAQRGTAPAPVRRTCSQQPRERPDGLGVHVRAGTSL